MNERINSLGLRKHSKKLKSTYEYCFAKGMELRLTREHKYLVTTIKNNMKERYKNGCERKIIVAAETGMLELAIAYGIIEHDEVDALINELNNYLNQLSVEHIKEEIAETKKQCDEIVTEMKNIVTEGE